VHIHCIRGAFVLKPLFKYADFNGRANRAEYWLFGLFQVLLYIGIGAFSVALAASGSIGTAVGTGMLLFCLVALGLFIPNLAVTFRRLHDSNRSAWWLLLYVPGILSSFMAIGELVSLATHAASSTPEALDSLAGHTAHVGIVGIIGDICQLVMFAYLVWPGTRGPNRFGSDPRDGGLDLTVFDAPEDIVPVERAETAAKTPHKPIFDFTSPEPAAAMPPPAPARVQPAMPSAAPGRQAPAFGKRR
jgi:uncharacterized membrane protein YhaH (DUF805 family)